MKCWQCTPREDSGEGTQAIVRATSRTRALMIAAEYWCDEPDGVIPAWFFWNARRFPIADGEGDLSDILRAAFEWEHEGEPVTPWWLEECEIYGQKSYREFYAMGKKSNDE